MLQAIAFAVLPVFRRGIFTLILKLECGFRFYDKYENRIHTTQKWQKTKPLGSEDHQWTLDVVIFNFAQFPQNKTKTANVRGSRRTKTMHK